MAILGRRDILGMTQTTVPADYQAGTRFVLKRSGTVSKMGFYLSGSGGAVGTQAYRGTIYSDNSGTPGSRLGYTVDGSITNGDAAGWRELDLVSPVTLEPGNYWLFLHMGSTNNVIGVMRISGAGTGWVSIPDAFSDGPVAEATGGSTSARQYGVYAYYEPAGAAKHANLVVPLEMLEFGAGSTTSQVNFNFSREFLDPANYDGTCAYEWEIVAGNTTAGNVDVYLVNGTTGAVKATITIPAGTNVPTRMARQTFTPDSGENNYYLRIPAVAGANYQVNVWSSRIIVTQVGATKTRLKVPMIHNSMDAASNATFTSEPAITPTTSTSYGDPATSAHWLRTDDNWGAVDSYDVETYLWSASGGATASLCLFNFTDQTVVTLSEMSEAGSSPVRHTVSLPAITDRFYDGKIYQLRVKTTNATYAARAYGSKLYLTITDLSKGEVSWYLGGKNPDDVNESNSVWSRVSIDFSDYSNPVSYHEFYGHQSTAGTPDVWLADDGTNDSGTGGTPIAGTTATPAVGTNALQRLAAFTPPDDGDRIYLHKDATGTALNVAMSRIVVAFTGSASSYLPGIMRHHVIGTRGVVIHG